VKRRVTVPAIVSLLLVLSGTACAQATAVDAGSGSDTPSPSVTVIDPATDASTCAEVSEATTHVENAWRLLDQGDITGDEYELRLVAAHLAYAEVRVVPDSAVGVATQKLLTALADEGALAELVDRGAGTYWTYLSDIGSNCREAGADLAVSLEAGVEGG
jgi:hypothetical protein